MDLEYDLKFDGVGIPKNNDLSRGHCSQIAIFSQKKIEEAPEIEPKIKYYAEEIYSIRYPFEEKNYQNFLKILKQQYK